jgi:predicted GH43/DUF377 family glycosyl hydrolase
MKLPAFPAGTPLAFILPEPYRRDMHHPAIESLPQFVRRHGLAPRPGVAREYNPAIAELGGKLVMAWRIQDERGLSRVVFAHLNKKFEPGKSVELTIPDLARKTHVEDPRLIVIGGKLIVFVATVYYGATFTFTQRAFVLGADFAIERELPLPYGKNGKGGNEKNWMPYARADGSLGIVYQVAPELVLIDPATHAERLGPGINRWKWGTVSGRTNGILIGENRYLAIIGGHQKHPERMSEYWLAAIVWEEKPTARIISVSREPILWASADSPALLNPMDPRWNPLCVFAAGLVRQGGELLVSMGVNDSYCALMRWSFADITAGLVSPDQITGEETLKLNGKPTPASAAPAATATVRVRSVAHCPVGEPGGPYMPGDEWMTTEDRASALGRKLVEVLP